MGFKGSLNGSLNGTLSNVTLRGYSAYQVAVQNGFTGTEDEWLKSLQGPQGIQGPQGNVGPAGAGVTSWNDLEDKPTEVDSLELCVEMGLVEPITSDAGAIYIDENEKIYIL